MSLGGDVTMKSRQRITIRLPKELNNKLADKVENLGISKNAFIIQNIWNELEKGVCTNGKIKD